MSSEPLIEKIKDLEYHCFKISPDKYYWDNEEVLNIILLHQAEQPHVLHAYNSNSADSNNKSREQLQDVVKRVVTVLQSFEDKYSDLDLLGLKEDVAKAAIAAMQDIPVREQSALNERKTPKYYRSVTSAHPALANAAEILANFKGEPDSTKLEEWQAAYAMLFTQMNEICNQREIPENIRNNVARAIEAKS